MIYSHCIDNHMPFTNHLFLPQTLEFLMNHNRASWKNEHETVSIAVTSQERHSFSNHRLVDCLFNSFFRITMYRMTKKKYLSYYWSFKWWIYQWCHITSSKKFKTTKEYFTTTSYGACAYTLFNYSFPNVAHYPHHLTCHPMLFAQQLVQKNKNIERHTAHTIVSYLTLNNG